MARDTALLSRAGESGESVFSVYGWQRPTLSFGRNQRASGEYDRAAIRRRNIDVVRRPTGGRAILHHREITYSVTAPVRENESLRESYERINLVLLEGLRRLGVSASVAAHRAAHAPNATPCFVLPAEGEIVAGGRKLIGSAQWREEKAFLQHGSILIDDDQSSLAALAAHPDSDASVTPPPPATLRALLGRAPAVEDVASAMFRALSDVEDCTGTVLSEDEVRPAAIAMLPDYLSDDWTWRR